MRRKTDTQNQDISQIDISPDEACRLDVWLYRTRLLKTRNGANQLIRKGKVRITRNGRTERIKKPHALIRRGDGVTFMRGTTLIDVVMKQAGTRRGPAPEAQQLYENSGQNHDKMTQD
ncbi:MAG: S4 domain-containing protein [Litorimonas sp.]